MKSDEKKLKADCPPGELGNLFRQIADGIDGRGHNCGHDFDTVFENFRKIGIKVKRRLDHVSVKIKVEQAGDLPEEAADGDAPDAPQPASFKTLKKRMALGFKQIRRSISEGKLPEKGAMQVFLKDSEVMTGFPGKGDESYGQYRHACQDLARAFERSDLAALQKICEELARLRKDCHRRYK